MRTGRNPRREGVQAPSATDRRLQATDIEVGEVVQNSFMAPVLFENLEDARVLVIARRKNLRRFTGQEYPGVGVAPVDEAADDEHADSMMGDRYFASGKEASVR